MSEFILNIARRSAGLGPGALVEPAPGPMFLPTLSNAQSSRDADAEDQPDIPGRRERLEETKQEFSTPGDKRSRTPFGNKSRSKPDANKAGSRIGDTRLAARGREGATDRLTSNSSVAGNISFNGSTSAQDDLQPPNMQSIIEPRSSLDVRYPHEMKSTVDKLSIDGPQQAREQFSAGLTPRLSEAPGKKEPSSAEAQSDQLPQGFEAVATGMIEPATSAAVSSNSLWESHQQQGAVMPLERQPIQVRIGTIEVRAEQVPAPRVAMSGLPAPQSGFDDYKSIR